MREFRSRLQGRAPKPPLAIEAPAVRLGERRRFIARAGAVALYGHRDEERGRARQAPDGVQGQVELVALPAPVLRDLRKLATEVVREESDKSPLARKVHASFARFQSLVGPWDQIAEGAYQQLVAR